MKKKTWDLYAPIYERAMRADRKVYAFMYERIPTVIHGKEVLEIATGPGLLAKHVAGAAKRMIATDYSDGMIREAKKGAIPENLTFKVADATALPYADDSFDAVLIANALHVMPEPEKALREIDRVLRPGGILIAPNFVEHQTAGQQRRHVECVQPAPQAMEQAGQIGDPACIARNVIGPPALVGNPGLIYGFSHAHA